MRQKVQRQIKLDENLQGLLPPGEEQNLETPEHAIEIEILTGEAEIANCMSVIYLNF